jgi:DNA polymerase III delta subunit
LLLQGLLKECQVLSLFSENHLVDLYLQFGYP